jgi:Flp pilus assembly protein TadG
MRNSLILVDRVSGSGARGFLQRQLRRFRRQTDGATAVEFGLIAGPFLAWMFAIIETALIFFAGQALETAVADSARLIMTGQAQKQGFDQGKFKDEICARITALFNCAEGIQVDVKSYPSFSGVTLTKPGFDEQEGKLDTSDFGYSPGKQGDVVIVRVVYEWPTFVRGLLGLDMSTLPNGKHLLMSTAAFRNEPYSN